MVSFKKSINVAMLWQQESVLSKVREKQNAWAEQKKEERSWQSLIWGETKSTNVFVRNWGMYFLSLICGEKKS